MRPLAKWNPARSVWETNETLICGHSDVYSETWPTSGTTRAGRAYARPTSAPPTDGSGSSSLPGLLKTPTAQPAVNGGSQHPDKRKAGGHGPTLADEIEHLLPTPAASDYFGVTGEEAMRKQMESRKSPGLDCLPMLLPTPRATDGTKGGPNQRGSSGDLMLPSAVMLLPTPTAQAAKHASDDRGPGTLDDGNLWSIAARIGASTDLPSDAGSS